MKRLPQIRRPRVYTLFVRLILGALAAAALCAGAEPDPTQILARLTAMVREQGRRVPNYTCVQTVDQVEYHPEISKQMLGPPGFLVPPPRRLATCADTATPVAFRSTPFRMEVRAGDSGEKYSWPGDGRFDLSLLHMLGGIGFSSTGSFAAVLHSIFADAAPGFRFNGETTIAGQAVYAYSFSIPEDRSTHVFPMPNGSEVKMAYEGTVFASRETGAPVRIAITVPKLPDATRCCRFSAELDYRRAPVGAEEFLLPLAARQTFFLAGGSKLENAFAFSSCRSFQAESRILSVSGEEHMDSPRPGGGPGMPLPEIPAGLSVSIRLSDAIDSATAAIGDRFSGRLDKPLVDRSRNEFAPAGALVRGRITGAERMLRTAHVMILLAVESLEIGGRDVPVRLAPERDSYSAWPVHARDFRSQRPSYPEWPPERQMVVQSFTKRHVIRAGTRLEWVTMPQR